MKHVLKPFLVVLLAASCIVYSCNQESTNDYSTLTISLTDNPGNYDNVFVEVVGVEVHTDGNGWESMPVDTAVYDLLTLQNGVDTVLVTPQSLPSGRISQVRLLLGDSNSVVVAGTTYPLSLSSQDETGLKCNVNAILQPNTAYQLMLDFDADQSVLQTGNGTYKLKPVVSAFFQ
jgi:hypothetical protein